jgi:PAS fold/GAF domain
MRALDRVPGLVRHLNRSARHLAPEPQDGYVDPAPLARADGDAVGRGRRHALQRRLLGLCRRPAPELLGSKVREGWPEVADFNDHVMKVGLAGGTLSYKDQELTLHGHGRPEQVWMNFDYSPVFDESGKPAGVLAIVVETTERVAAERRHAFRLAIEERLRGLNEPTDMMEEATALLGRHLGVAQVGFAEVEDDQEHIVVARDWNDGHIPSVVGRWRMDDFGPQFIRALKAGQTIPIRDVALDPRTRAPEAAAYDGINTRAILDVPLVRDGHMVALLFIHDPEARANDGHLRRRAPDRRRVPDRAPHPLEDGRVPVVLGPGRTIP